MLSWRAKKQFSMILFLIVMLAMAGFYVFLKTYFVPSCFDNVRNGGEEDVDCGGPSCVSCEEKHAKELKIFWVKGAAVRQNTYDVVALVENQNEVLASPEVQYEFVLSDAAGELGKRSGTAYLFPQERLYVVELGLDAPRTPTRVDFLVRGATWQKWTAQRPNLVVERREYVVKKENGVSQSVVEASIFNRTSFDFRQFEVRFAVFDVDGNLIGANRVMGEKLLSGTRQLVKSIWPQQFSAAVGDIDVQTRINVFDPLVIIRPQ